MTDPADPVALGQADDPLLLFFNDWFRQDPPASQLGSLRWTRDRARLAEARIVLFHLPLLHFSQLRNLPKYPGQVWVSWSQESDAHYPRQADASVSQLFDLTIRFHRNADIWASYVPPLADWEAARAQPISDKPEPAAVVMMQSATIDRSDRTAFAAELMQHIAIDSYGKVLNNRAFPAGDDGPATKLALIARYKFCIGFENARQVDYVTEKLYQPLLAGTVPVYRGAANVAEFAPPGSYINADDFAGPRELAAYLAHLSASPAEYAAYFNWRDAPLPASLRAVAQQNEIGWFPRLAELVAHRFPAGEKHGATTRPFTGWDYALLRIRELLRPS